MLLRTDPFRELTSSVAFPGLLTRQSTMPIDIYRAEDAYLVQVDLPGVHQDSIEVFVQRNVLSISARLTRPDQGMMEVLVSERPKGLLSRRLNLGEEIDAEHIQADYIDGVLLIRLPIAEHAKPQRVQVGTHERISDSLNA